MCVESPGNIYVLVSSVMELYLKTDHNEQVIHVMITPVESNSCFHGDLYQPVRPGEYLTGGGFSYEELMLLGNGMHVIADSSPDK